ncbi:MAG: hypothetical protein JNG84_11970 [Archangium sp.]|nr:hypothetical protein [Archangium sp.]
MSKQREAQTHGRRPSPAWNELDAAEAAPKRSTGAPAELHPEMHGDLVRRFEGSAVLQRLLTSSGSLADVEDVAEAFREAIAAEAPASVVIQALWEDEPRFERPTVARQTFSNLLGLFDLIASGATVDLRPEAPPVRTKRPKAPAPAPFTTEPDEAFVEAAWRYFDDAPKARERHQHSFDNRQDALLTWLDDTGLSDEGFSLVTMLVSDVYAMLELGGMKVGLVEPKKIHKRFTKKTLPPALLAWLEEGTFEAQADETAPLKAADAKKALDVARRATAAMWAACRVP